MKLAFALCTIIHRPDGNKEVSREPHSVFPCGETEYDELAALGAVREPTKDEVALYRLQNGGKIVDDDGAKKAGKSKDKEPKPESPKSDAPGADSTPGAEGPEGPSGSAGDDGLVG